MSKNLAAENPGKLKELQALFTKEAIDHHVLPIDDRTIERFDPKVAGRPDLMDGRKKLTVYPGMVFLAENAFINVKNASVDMVADVEVQGEKNHGVLVAQCLYLCFGQVSSDTGWGVQNVSRKLAVASRTA